MKNSKKISVLISLVLILLLAIGAASAADDAIMTDDSDLASVDEVQTVDNTQTTDEIYTEPTDIVVTDTGDSGDLDDADSDVISDTGLKGDSDDGDEAVVSDASSPKNALKAVTDPDEPLGAEPDGSFRDLYNLLNGASGTVTLDRNYVYNPSTDNNYRNGITIAKNLNINGNGFTIDGQGVARGLILNGYTSTSWLIITVYHGYTYGLNNINFVNLSTTADAGAAIASHVYPNTVTISNCNFTNNRGNRGAISVSVQNPDASRTDVDTGSVTITGSIFKDNYASDRGGAIYSGISYDRTSITANNNVFINNTAAGYAQAIFYSNANYINVNYNWWGQNAWNNNFVAQSNNNRITPTYRYLADFTQTSGKTLELTLALNGGTAPSESALPVRNASFSIDSGIVDPESEMFQGSIEVTYASLEDTTITANVDNQQFTLEVSKTPRENINELTITVADVVLPNQAQVIVNTDVRGTFNVTIGDTVKEVNITNGQATIAWDSLPAGQYFAVVSCVGDIRYNDKFAYTSFKVEKQNVTITVTATPDTIVYGDGETVTLSSALNDTAATAGTVTYYVDGTESGTTLDDLTVGTYEVIAKYTGDPIYNDAESAPITVTVSKPRPTISVTANPIMYGQDATITIGLHGLNDESITGLVKVTINGKIYDVAVSNGVGTLTVSGLAAREDGYPISVEFAGNENYNSANNYSTKQVVHKAQPIIGVTPVEISYGEDAVVNITLEHPNGEKLDGVVVIATVDGEDYPVTISNGVGTLTVRDLIVENYDVMVYFPGNDNYSSVETTRYDSIVVKKAVVDVSVGNVVVTRPATGTIVLTASAPGEYIVKVGDEEYQAIVEFADVSVEIPILSMLAGSYDVKVTADETRNYEEVDVTFEDAYVVIKRNITVEATPNATEIACGDNITLNHSISAPEGAVLTGDVSYYIDGEKVESVFTGSKVGTYTFTVSYSGDPDYNDAVSAPVTLTVNKITPIFWIIPNNKTYGDHPSVGVFLFKEKTIFGGLPGITVLVTINNVTYAVETTDFLGGYILYLDGLDANEEGYSISAVSLETDEYASVSNNTEVLKIYKANARLTVDSDRTIIDFGETITLSHEITEGATGAVTYYLNGTAVPGNILSNLMPGNYTVTAKYEGNKNYKPADSVNTLNITVKKANPKLSVSANNTVIKYLDSIKLLRVFDTPASGEVVWYVNGTPQMSNIVEDLKPGTYTVTAKYIEDEFYYDADSLNSLTITVLKEDVEIAVRSNAYTIEYGDSINLNSIIEPTEAWDGDVIYIVDGRETSNPTVSGLDVGTHSVIAKYVENDYFNEAYSEAITINVNKVAPSIEVSSDPVTYPNDAIVNFIVKGNNNLALPGVGIRVTINGVGYYVETGSDGKAVLTVKGLNVGEHTIGTVTVANDNYGTATNNTEKIIVNKGDLTITAGTSASSVAYGDEIRFTNTITAPEGAVVSGNVKYYVDGNEISGEGISTLAIGDHTVVAEYSGDANFNAVNSTAVSFTVTKADPTLTISANATEIQYLDDIKLSYTITPDGATGSVVYYLDGTPVDGDVLRLLEPGNYTVTAKYEGNDYYNEADSSNSLKITVGKCDVSIEVNSNYYAIEYGQAILLSAACNPFISTGYITYIVDGVEGNEVYFTDLSVGTHSIAARFNENVFYNGALSETKFVTVTKATPEITVTANPIVYGQDATITIGLDGVNDEKITGVVKVTIGGKDYDVAVSNGVGTITLSGLVANEEGHAITAAFAGNDNYNDITNTDAKQVVNKAESSIELEDVIVTYGEDAVVEFTVNGVNGEKLGDFAYLSFNYGPAYLIDLHDGVGRIRFSGLNVGTYNVHVSYEDNDNYDRVVKEANVIVKNAAINVTGQDLVVIYPGKGSITITTDVAGAYTIKVGDNTYENVDLVAGENTFAVPDALEVGDYPVKVSAEIENYDPLVDEEIATYTVNQADVSISISANATEITYGDSVSMAAVISPDAITDDDITYYVDGTAVTSATLADLPAGTHTVVAKFAGNKNYKAAESNAVTITVNKAKADVTVTAESVTYPNVATVVVNSNVPGTYTIRVGNKDYAVVVGDTGSGSTVINQLLPRNYEIDLTADLGDNYEPVYQVPAGSLIVMKANPTLTVSTEAIVYGEDATINVALEGVNGEKITGVVKVTIDGKDYDVPVTNGAGTLTVSGLAANEEGHAITAAFAGNDYYNAITDTDAKQVVNKAESSIELEDVIVTYGEDAVVEFTVNGVNGEKLGDFAYLSFNYGPAYLIDLHDGVGRIRFSGLDAGTYNVHVSYEDNDNYDRVVKEANVIVNKAVADVNVTSTTVVYPNTGSINLTASVPGQYIVKVGGVNTYTATVTAAGVPVEVQVTDVLGVYAYDISVTADLGNNYELVDTGKIGTYNVVAGSTSLAIAVEDFTYGDEDATATITLRTGDYPMAEKDVVVSFGEFKKTVTTDENGVATVDLSELNAGRYRIVAVFEGDYNCPAASANNEVIVRKAEPTVTVSVDAITYGEDAEIKISVAGVKGESLTGIAYVGINGRSYNVAIRYGYGYLIVSDLPANEEGLEFVVDFEETENHLHKLIDYSVVVHKANIIVDCEDETVYYPNWGLITFTASVPGQYKVVVGDKEYTANVETAGGSAEVSVDPLDEGLYNVIISADESANYNAVEKTFTNIYTVLQGTVNLGITVTNVTYPGKGTITIAASVPGVYTVEVGGKIYSAKVETADGRADITVDTLDVNIYDIYVTRTNIDNYNDVNEVFDDAYTVNPATVTVSCENVTVIFPDYHYITITASVPGWYSVKVGEEIYDVKVGEDGTGSTAPLQWGPGVYDVSVTADLGPNYNSVDTGKIGTYTVVANTITVTGVDTAVQYPGKKTISITTNVAGVYTIKVGDKTYENVELVAGTNGFDVPDVLPVGVYAVKVSADIEGYDPLVDKEIATYTVTSNIIIVTGQDVSVTYPGKGSIIITADVAGAYTIKVGDNVYENVELVAGENTFEVPDVLDEGEYAVKVSADIENYYPLEDMEIANYTVTPATITVTGQEVSVAYPGKGNITITTNVAGAYTIKVGDNTYENVELVAGENTFEVPDVLPVGNYPVNVYADIDNYYIFDDIISSYIVTAGTITVTGQDGSANYPGRGTIVITTDVAGAYTIKVGGNVYENVELVAGENTFEVPDVLAAGNYPVKVSADIEGYDTLVDKEIATYTVAKADLTIVVGSNATEITLGDEIGFYCQFNVSEDLLDDDAVVTYYVDGKPMTDTDMPIFNVGEHIVVARYTGDANFNDAESAPIEFLVVKVKPIIEVLPSESTYPNGQIKIVAKDKNGNYLRYLTVIVSVAGVNYAVIADEAGRATLDIEGIDAGTYDIVASAVEDAEYGPALNNTEKLVVSKVAVTVEIPNSVIVTYPETGYMGIKASVPGTYTVKVGEEEIPVVITEADTIVLFNITKVLDAGKYNVTVSADLGNNYEPVDTGVIATYTVNKGDIGVRSNQSYWTVTYPEKGTILLITNTSGNFTLKVGDVSYPVELFAGENEFAIPDILNVGPHNVSISADIDNYNPLEDEHLGTYMVYIGKINVTAEDVSVIFPDYHYITITASVAGWYYVKVGEEVWEVFVSEDGGTGITSNLKYGVGTYDVSVTADFGDNYEPVDTGVIAKYVVSPAEAGIVVSAENYLTTQTGELVIAVSSGVQGAITGTATVEIDGAIYKDNVAVEDGSAVVKLENIGVGEHNVKVIFHSTDFKEIDNITTFTVSKSTPVVEVTGATVEYGDPATVKVKVTDEDGNPVAGTVIVVASWGVDGETQVIELEADGTGEATFVLAGVAPGTVDLKASFIGNDKYDSSYNGTEKIIIKDSTDLILEVSANEVTVGEDTILTVTAKDGTGAGIDIDQVNVSIDGGEPKLCTVGEDGTINLGALEPGEHTIVVSVDDELYGHVEDSTEAKVNKLTANVDVVPGNGTVNITAKDNKTGEPISGTATVVIDGGEPQNVTIGEDGTIEYPIDAAPGPHTVEVTFNKDGYEPASQTVVVTVPKAETTLTIAGEGTPSYGDDVTVKATITEGAKGTITYYIDGSSVGTELAIGQDFVISGLSAGEHTITAKYAGNENYTAAESNILKVNIEKADLEITIVSAQTYYPNTGTVNVSANKDGEYTINVNDKPYTVFIVNGKGSFEVTEVLSVAEYPITWDIEASENYTGNAGSAIYKVLNTEPDFSISGSSEIDYGKTNTIVPTINADATGTITYSINGEEVDTLDVKENFVTDVLDAGHYTVTATYSGDVNYGSKTATFEFDVLPIDVVVSVASDEVYYPNLGSVNLTASAPGTYTVLVGNKSYEVVVTEANVPVTVEVTDLFEVGKYEINVTAPASTNYNAVDTGAIGTYVVSKAKSIIKVEYDSATGMATVTLEGAEDHVPLSESISFELDGTSISGVETTDGVYETEDLALAPGKHSIFVVFVGNDNYLGSYDQVAFEVDKFATAEVTVSADPIKEGEDAIIKIAVKDGDKGLTGVVTVTLDGTDYAVDVTDGAGTLTVKNLVATTSPVTTYDITAKFNGNDEYAEATGTGTIDVTDYNDVLIVISGGQDSAVATLVDTDGNNITGKVNVTVDGGEPQEFDVVDGKVIIPIDEKGDHEITVDYAGDGTHPSASKTDTVFVGKTLISTTLTLTVSNITYTEDEEAVVVLSAEDGSRLSGTVTLTIGDKVQEVTITDGIGVTTVTGLSAGKKTAIAEFAESGKYAYSIATAPFEVRQMNTRIVARNMTTTAINVTEDGRIGEYLVWTLVDEKGRPLAGKAMSIGFNAKVYNRTTDANGQARLQINLQNSGPYTFAISFLGDDNYNGSFEVVVINVNKQKATLAASGATYKASAATKTLSATYKTKAGKPIVGKTIKFTVNGKTYSAKTDSKGVAKVNVSLTKAGSYTVEVKAPATNTYAETIKKVTLKLT